MFAYEMPVGEYEQPPTQPTLRAYCAEYGRDVAEVFVALGLDPVLADRVDQRVQVLPRDVADDVADYLGRPRAELGWAAGGRLLMAPQPATMRRSYWVAPPRRIDLIDLGD